MDKSKFNIKKEWRKFGIAFAIVLSILGTIQLLTGRNFYFYFYSASVAILLSSLFFPIILKPIFIVFSYIGFGINWLITRIILSLTFFIIFTSIGMLSKLFGKKYLDTTFKNDQESYWISRDEKLPDITSYEKQF